MNLNEFRGAFAKGNVKASVSRTLADGTKLSAKLPEGALPATMTLDDFATAAMGGTKFGESSADRGVKLNNANVNAISGAAARSKVKAMGDYEGDPADGVGADAETDHVPAPVKDRKKVAAPSANGAAAV